MLNKIKLQQKRKLIIGWSVFALINLVVILLTVLLRAGLPNLVSKGVTPFSAQAFGDAFIFLITRVYLDNFLRQPALLLGVITLIGYLALGRGGVQSVVGALKTVIGFILLSIGSGVLVSTARPVFDTIKGLGGTGVVLLDSYFSLASANDFFTNSFLNNDYVSLIAFSLLVGFIVNIIFVGLKRWTNTNSIMVTGHVMLQQAAVVTTLFYIVLFRQIPLLGTGIAYGAQAGLVIISGIFLGVYWSTASTGTYLVTNKVTNNAGFSIGHQQMLGIMTVAKLGKYFGDKNDSAEHKKLPKALKIFEDNIFTQTIIILSLFVVLFIVILASYKGDKPLLINWDKFGAINGLEIWNTTFSGANFTLNIIGGALKMVASLIAIMTGVRMFITELQQAFQGISEKVVPGAVVAVDIAAVYGFSINSVTFGFLSGVIGQFLAVAIMAGISYIPGNQFSFVAIPLFITLFFNSGAFGVYANAEGGWKAALLIPGIIGFLEIIVISFALRTVSNAYQASALLDAKQSFDLKALMGNSLDNNNGSALKTAVEKVVNATGVNRITEAQSFVKSDSFNSLKAVNSTLAQAIEWISKSASPVDNGFIGMADWNLYFGLLVWIGAYNVIGGWILVILATVGLILLAQIIDNGKQTKVTKLQQLLKINPQLDLNN